MSEKNRSYTKYRPSKEAKLIDIRCRYVKDAYNKIIFLTARAQRCGFNWYFKLSYGVLRVHTFWYDLFRLEAICQFLVTR